MYILTSLQGRDNSIVCSSKVKTMYIEFKTQNESLNRIRHALFIYLFIYLFISIHHKQVIEKVYKEKRRAKERMPRKPKEKP